MTLVVHNHIIAACFQKFSDHKTRITFLCHAQLLPVGFLRRSPSVLQLSQVSGCYQRISFVWPALLTSWLARVPVGCCPLRLLSSVPKRVALLPIYLLCGMILFYVVLEIVIIFALSQCPSPVYRASPVPFLPRLHPEIPLLTVRVPV